MAVFFKHSGQMGDIIYSLPFIKSVLGRESNKAVIFIPSDKKANHAPGLKHVSGALMMTKSMFDFFVSTAGLSGLY